MSGLKQYCDNPECGGEIVPANFVGHPTGWLHTYKTLSEWERAEKSGCLGNARPKPVEPEGTAWQCKSIQTPEGWCCGLPVNHDGAHIGGYAHEYVWADPVEPEGVEHPKTKEWLCMSRHPEGWNCLMSANHDGAHIGGQAHNIVWANVCEYCGPTCYGGAAHNARVENGDRKVVEVGSLGGEREDLKMVKIERPSAEQCRERALELIEKLSPKGCFADEDGDWSRLDFYVRALKPQPTPEVSVAPSGANDKFTPCCNYGFKTGDTGPIFWNPWNKAVCCHNCGAAFDERKPKC